MALAGLISLHVLPHPPSPSPTGIYPQQGQGFAAYFVEATASFTVVFFTAVDFLVADNLFAALFFGGISSSRKHRE